MRYYLLGKYYALLCENERERDCQLRPPGVEPSPLLDMRLDTYLAIIAAALSSTSIASLSKSKDVDFRLYFKRASYLLAGSGEEN